MKFLGVNGLKPKLSINYNSNSGNGYLGVGFSLGGLSSINRCAKNLATDGVRGSINFDENDRYCLDGQRLIAIVGKDGEAGSEYRTEINNYSRVTYNGDYWQVENKAGQTLKYGATFDSKMETSDHKYIKGWQLTSINDSANNVINYSYTKNTTSGEHYIHTIEYADNTIAFDYITHDNSLLFYSSGYKTTLAKLLQSITISASNNQLVSYKLSYRKVGIRNVVQSLQKCFDEKCLPETVFESDMHTKNSQKDNGWEGAPEYTPPFYIKADRYGELGVRFHDVNGDGLVDMIYHRVLMSGHRQKGAYLNTGNGWEGAPEYTPPFPIKADEHGELGVRFHDVNGDGLVDMIYHRVLMSGRRQKGAYLNTGNGFIKLTSINNSNKIISIKYNNLINSLIYTKTKKSTYPNTILGGSSMQVVSEITTTSSTRQENATSYKYKNYGINPKRGPLGFEEITAHNKQTRQRTVTTYNQEYPFIGLINATDSFVDGRLVSNTTNNYKQTIQKGQSLVTDVYLQRSIEKTYDYNSANLLKTATTTNSNVDSFGNIGQITTAIIGNTTGEKFTTVTYNAYQNNSNNWHIGKLIYSRVTHKNGNGNPITKTSVFNYNPLGQLSGEIIEPNGNKSLGNFYVYDNFGNIIRKVTTGSDIVERDIKYQYDSTGRDLIKTTNALGHSETKTYDHFGDVTSLTGPNGLTTTWQYDSLGRKIAENRADGTTTTYKYLAARNEVVFDNNNKSLYKVITTNNGIDNTTYFDNFGNKLRTIKVGFDGTAVYEDIYYNHLRQIVKQSLPYYKDDTQHFIYSYHDGIGRVIQTTKPNDEGNQITNKIMQYRGYQTTIKDSLGNSKTTTKNAKGQIVRVDEPAVNGVKAYLTHTYDAIGNLIRTDANGVITTLTYDTKGNKIQMNDPSMGVWSYKYNALGELTSQTDAKGQTTFMEYDKLGRMIKRTAKEGTTTWQYDNADKAIGKLVKVNAPLGFNKSYTYDKFGRIKDTTTYTDGQSFTTINSYDKHSRLAQQTLPHNFVVENVYNESGYLLAVRSPKEQIQDYDFEHLAKLLNDSMMTAEEALKKASHYQHSADRYTYYATIYKNMANNFEKQSANYQQEVTELRSKAATLLASSHTLKLQAAYQERKANAWYIAVKRYLHLAEMDVDVNKARSYVDTESERTGWSTWFYSGHRSNKIAYSYDNGNASCNNEFQCRYLSTYSSNIGDRYRRLADDKVAKANNLIGEVTSIHKKADYLAYLALRTATKSKVHNNFSTSYIGYAQRYQNSANYWHKIAENALKDDNKSHYQEMLADSQNIYFWRAKSRDAANRLTGHLVGNGLSTENTYNPATGNLATIKSGFSDNKNIRDLAYQYDSKQNVIERRDNNNHITENFEYDTLDRMVLGYTRSNNNIFNPVNSNNSGNVNSNNTSHYNHYRYDIKGNITQKDNTNYNYNTNSPYQVASTTNNSSSNNGNNITNSYIYDNNGNVTTYKTNNQITKQIQYSSFNKPTRLSNANGSQTTNFIYDNSNNRYLKVQNTYNGSLHTQIRTIYIGKHYERITDSSKQTTTHKYFIYNADNELVTIHSKTQKNNPFETSATIAVDKTNYLHYDNLGSIDTITDGQGNIVSQTHYRPFGNQVVLTKAIQGSDANATTNTTTTDNNSNISNNQANNTQNSNNQNNNNQNNNTYSSQPLLTNRGYTGHEHIDEFGFIHMNGRVYDPHIGRFLSADFYVQSPYNTQSYNRYSYVWNNPNKYRDPSGYWTSSRDGNSVDDSGGGNNDFHDENYDWNNDGVKGTVDSGGNVRDGGSITDVEQYKNYVDNFTNGGSYDTQAITNYYHGVLGITQQIIDDAMAKGMMFAYADPLGASSSGAYYGNSPNELVLEIGGGFGKGAGVEFDSNYVQFKAGAFAGVKVTNEIGTNKARLTVDGFIGIEGKFQGFHPTSFGHSESISIPRHKNIYKAKSFIHTPYFNIDIIYRRKK